ncbi:MAG: PrsW family glutamic-type intramembrane protease [Candidatus Peregrinibacteria bacterium]|nr:PrsW family glutamic-type intramembrane protease [Candidatus Peregrinibacteria bacterium]
MELLVLALAPSVAIGMLFYLRDKYDREPLGLLFKTFLLGALTIIPVGFAEYWLFELWGIDIFNTGSLLTTLLAMLFLVALVEESAKFLVVRWYAWNKPEFNEPYDGIIYTLMASLGFATVENILYVIQWGATVAWLRAFLTVPMHALTAVIMGYYIGLAKYSKTKKESDGNMYTGLWIAILFHGFFNWFVSSNITILILMAPVLVGYSWYVGLRASKISATSSPFKKL